MIHAEREAHELYSRLIETLPDNQILFELPAPNEVLITITNPYGGLPVYIFANDFDHEYKVVYFKTARFFTLEPDGITALLKAVADYLDGRTAYLLAGSATSDAGCMDRLVFAYELPDADLEALTQLCIDKNLLTESQLLFELQAGAAVNVNFWDPSKNFCYKLSGGKLVKI